MTVKKLCARRVLFECKIKVIIVVNLYCIIYCYRNIGRERESGTNACMSDWGKWTRVERLKKKNESHAIKSVILNGHM